MRNIRKFETFEDYLASQESVSGSGKYVEDIRPGFVYVKERYEDGTYSFYNGEDIGQEEEYEFGDVVYYVKGEPKLKKVYYSAFTPDMGEKVGLVVVPTALSPDGNARIMAFGSITTEAQPEVASTSLSVSKPETKDTLLGASTSYSKVNDRWYDRMADENQTVYTCVPAFNLGGGSLPQASAPGSEGRPSYYEKPLYLSFSTSYSTFSSDANYEYPNPHTNNEYYNATGALVAISPFLGDSLKEQDPAYLQEEFTGGTYPAYNAFSDFSGYTWTYGCPPEYTMTPGAPALKSSKPVSGTSNPYFPHDHVRQFYTDGTAEGDWYLPSMGEMGFVVARYKKIMEIFEYLFSKGAYVEDGTDNMPGFSDIGTSAIWTSTVGALMRKPLATPAPETTLSASIPGNGTSPYVYPITVIVSPVSGINFDLQFAFDEGNNNEVLPFAMIKKGEIQRTMGNYAVANGHQMKDYQRGTNS